MGIVTTSSETAFTHSAETFRIANPAHIDAYHAAVAEEREVLSVVDR